MEATKGPEEKLTDSGLLNIVCAAPILRSLILSEIQSPPITVAIKDVPDANNLDPRWLLARTIEVGLSQILGDGTILTELAKYLLFFPSI